MKALIIFLDYQIAFKILLKLVKGSLPHTYTRVVRLVCRVWPRLICINVVITSLWSSGYLPVITQPANKPLIFCIKELQNQNASGSRVKNGAATSLKEQVTAVVH